MSLISRATAAGPSRVAFTNISPRIVLLQATTKQLFPVSPSCGRWHSTASTAAKPSHAYIHPSASFPNAPSITPSPQRSSSTNEGTTDNSVFQAPPDLTSAEKEIIERIIRVDQAGELGANWIYRGQKMGTALRGDTKTVQQIEEMWQSERHHLATMRLLQKQFSVRPTLLYPLWQVMAFGLGASTALMGNKAAMACTEAVETVIGEHYDDQIKALKPLLEKVTASGTPHPSLVKLKEILEEFRDDELEHLDTAVEEGAQQAPGHALLSAIIGAGCKVAIKVSERI